MLGGRYRVRASVGPRGVIPNYGLALGPVDQEVLRRFERMQACMCKSKTAAAQQRPKEQAKAAGPASAPSAQDQGAELPVQEEDEDIDMSGLIDEVEEAALRKLLPEGLDKDALKRALEGLVGATGARVKRQKGPHCG